MGKEILDIVSNCDKIIGKLDRDTIYRIKSKNFRTINAFLVNKDEEVWLPIRHSSKKLWPNKLDASVGGHVRSGETYLQAFVREAQEEINLNVQTIPWKLIAKLSPYEHKISSFMEIYLIYYNGSINFNHDDFVKGYWYSIKSVISFIEKKQIDAKPDLLPILKHLNNLWRATHQ